jgi:metalloendopeptidase OMA1, mitochondrial
MVTATLPFPGKSLTLVAALAWLVLAGCTTAPYTGRKQVLMVSPQQEQALGYQAFADIRRHSKAAQDPALQARVREVGERIARAADRPDYHWEFVVFKDDKMANAFCLPGGKVGVYTGLFKYIHNDDDLATVLSHEVAHALARHAGERLSQGRLAQAGGLALGVALAALGLGSGASQVAMQGYGLGTKVGVLLPYNRVQESEADKIGLILMAKAGYDPKSALTFWESFATGKKDQTQTPQFLSTHPSDATRIQNIRAFLPEAERYYVASRENPSPAAPEWSTHRTSPQAPSTP